jgi:hypothetical protein
MRHNVAMSPRTVTASRYVTPLREGGSLPAIVEADDDGLYVLKFRGAGQGPKALIAELVAGELARAIGLPVPEIVFMHLDADLARSEPDPEIQDLIRASVGLNLALDYLPGSVTFDPLAERPAAGLASDIVWFDALIGNVDRTARNANLLVWHRALWLIDHGAALYFHHNWVDHLENSRRPFVMIKDHVLLPFADDLAAADERLAARITHDRLTTIVALIPDDWLLDDPHFEGADAKQRQRDAYVAFLTERLRPPRNFAVEARHAREGHHHG